MKKIPVSPLNWRGELATSATFAETTDLASRTVPDQTLSLKELISRHTRGIPVPTFDPVYDGEENFPDLSRMTPMEVQDFRDDLQLYINENIHLVDPPIEPNSDPDPVPDLDPVPDPEPEK